MAEDIETHFHETTFIDESGEKRTIKIPVVQEISRRNIKTIPTRFIWPQNPNTKTTPPATETNHFPCINIAQLQAALSTPETRSRELEKLAEGAKKWGAFTISNHGIPPEVLKGVREVVEGFFELSFEEKKKSVGSYAGIDNVGYGRTFAKSEDKPLAWIDRITIKVAPAKASDGLRVWPETPPCFREAIEKYVKEARSTLNIILESLAESLSLPQQAFLQHFHPNNSEMNLRINYYPPCPYPDRTVGIVPHSDGSVLTLLLQFGATGGLQLLKDQHWFTVPWPSEGLLVVVGDLLEIMSGGRVESLWHKAVTQKDVERFSVALFYNPPSTAEIEPPLEVADGGYKKVVVRDYLQHLYKISPTPEKEGIKFAKVCKG